MTISDPGAPVTDLATFLLSLAATLRGDSPDVDAVAAALEAKAAGLDTVDPGAPVVVSSPPDYYANYPQPGVTGPAGSPQPPANVAVSPFAQSAGDDSQDADGGH